MLRFFLYRAEVRCNPLKRLIPGEVSRKTRMKGWATGSRSRSTSHLTSRLCSPCLEFGVGGGKVERTEGTEVADGTGAFSDQNADRWLDWPESLQPCPVNSIFEPIHGTRYYCRMYTYYVYIISAFLLGILGDS